MELSPSSIISSEHEMRPSPGPWMHEEVRAAGRILDELKTIDSPPLSRTEAWLCCSKKLSEVGYNRTAAAIQRRFSKAWTAQSSESILATLTVITPAEARGAPSNIPSLAVASGASPQQDDNSSYEKDPASDSSFSSNGIDPPQARSLRPRDKSVNYSISHAFEKTWGDEGFNPTEYPTGGHKKDSTNKRRRPSYEKKLTLVSVDADHIAQLPIRERSDSLSSPETMCDAENISRTKKARLKNIPGNSLVTPGSHSQSPGFRHSDLPVEILGVNKLAAAHILSDNTFRQYGALPAHLRTSLRLPSNSRFSSPSPGVYQSSFAADTRKSTGSFSPSDLGSHSRYSSPVTGSNSASITIASRALPTQRTTPTSDHGLSNLSSSCTDSTVNKSNNNTEAAASKSGTRILPDGIHASRARTNMIQATRQRITALQKKRSDILNNMQTGDSRIGSLQGQITILQSQLLTMQNEMKELKRTKAEKEGLADVDWEISEEQNTLKRLEQKDQVE